MPVLIHDSKGISGGEDEILRTYTVSADGPIAAGDLCEFVNGAVRRTKLKTASMGIKTDLKANARNTIKATVLDDTHVLIVTSDAGTNLYGQILVIDEVNGTITKGAKTQLTSVSVLTPGYDVCGMSSTFALVAFKNTTNGYVCLLPLTISGTTITAGTIVNDTARGSTTEVALEKYATNSLIMFSLYGAYVNYVPIYISGNVPSFGAFVDNWLSDTYYTTTKLRVNKVDESGVNPYFIVERHGVYNYNGTTPQNDTLFANYIKSTAASANGNMYGLSINTGIQRKATDYCVSNGWAGRVVSVLSDVNSQYVSVLKNSILLKDDGTVSAEFPSATNVFQTILREQVANLNIFQYEKDKHIFSYTGNPYGSIRSSILNFTDLDCVSMTTPIQQNSVNSRWIETIRLNSGALLNLSSDPSDSYYVRADLQQVLRGYPRPFKVLGYEDPRGVALNSANVGESVKLLIKGVKNVGKTLQPGCKYYCDENGLLTINVTPYYVGTSLNSQDLEVTSAWWDRGL